MRLQGMDQNSFFLDAIDREAIKMWANSHLQNCLSNNGITPKTSFKSYFNNISLCQVYFLKLKFPWLKIF